MNMSHRYAKTENEAVTMYTGTSLMYLDKDRRDVCLKERVEQKKVKSWCYDIY